MKSTLSVLRRWIDLDRQLVRGGVVLGDFAKKWKVHYITVLRDIRALRALGQVPRCSGGRRDRWGYEGSDPLFYRNVPTVEGEQGEGR